MRIVLRGIWDNIKCTNIHIIGSQKEKKEKRNRKHFEDIMVENISSLEKETDIQVQKAQKVPNKMNRKRSTPRHIIIKMSKSKYSERILKAARGKQLVTYKVTPINMIIYEARTTLTLKPEKNITKKKSYRKSP